MQLPLVALFSVLNKFCKQKSCENFLNFSHSKRSKYSNRAVNFANHTKIFQHKIFCAKGYHSMKVNVLWNPEIISIVFQSVTRFRDLFNSITIPG